MKVFTAILKILTALAAVAGIVYVLATYGDKLVAWAKKLLGTCCCCDDTCGCEAACPCECTEAPAEDLAEAPAEEAEEKVGPADFAE